MAAFILLTMAASVLVTLTVADRFVAIGSEGTAARAASSESSGQYGLSEKELRKLNTVLGLIETKYFRDVDRAKVMDGAINGMMEALDDPYSVYMEKAGGQAVFRDRSKARSRASERACRSRTAKSP